MRSILIASIALLLLPTPVSAQRRRAVCPLGTFMDLGGCRPQPTPTPARSPPQRSCPMDFVWNAQAGGCMPVVRCPYTMAVVNGRCEMPQRR